MAELYVGVPTATMWRSAEGKAKKDFRCELLWGDRAEVIEDGAPRAQVRARGRTGFVDVADLQGKSLLELYFIDVGQGDGVLVRTPDGRHILIDAGWPRSGQPTGKNAADFVDWKFNQDLGQDLIALDAVICSHNDQDHYGGLWDLLNPQERKELRCRGVTVDAFYHAGLSWWRKPDSGSKWLGASDISIDGKMFTQLLGDRASLSAALSGEGGAPTLAGEWRSFFECVHASKTRFGEPTPVARLSTATELLPGFEGGDGEPAIRVLGPVEFDIAGKPAIRRFAGADSQQTNGNSVLLRIDYGRSRILLTGDLNRAAQRALLADYADRIEEFACDVAKCCHHGSEDVSMRFLEAMGAVCTVISSGDSEGHDHPRPNVVAASGLAGHRTMRDDRLLTPFVYSTELARSVNLGRPVEVEVLDQDDRVVQKVTDVSRVRVRYEETKAGDRNPTSGAKRLSHTKVVSGLIYGLVNARTDGERILCAVLNEKNARWNVEGFAPRPR